MKTWRFVITYTAGRWTAQESREIRRLEQSDAKTQSLEAQKMRSTLAENEMTGKSVDTVLVLNSGEAEEPLPNAPRPCRFILFGLGLSQPNELPSQSETLLLER